MLGVSTTMSSSIWRLAAAPWSAALGLWQQLDRGAAPWPRDRPGAPPGDPLRLLLESLYAGAVAASRLWPADETGFRETRNKLLAFARFRYGERALRRADDAASAPLTDRALWVEEGIGYEAARRLGGSEVAGARHRLFATAPPPARVPRHTGLGMSLAAASLGVDSNPAAVIERFVARAGAAAMPRYRPAALESLGLIVRTLQPELLASYDRLTARRGDELNHLFWHGVGRGLYFAPTEIYSCVGGRWSALARALSEARHESGRRNATAGLSWALTLVNLRHPRVVEARLRSLTGRPEAVDPAAHGVLSALMIWLASTGDAAAVERFLAHRPGGDAAWRRVWDERLIARARSVLASAFPSLARSERLAELFRYRPLDRLVGEAAGDDAGRTGAG